MSGNRHGKPGVATLLAALAWGASANSAEGPVDPGVRAGAPGAGGPLQGLTSDELAFFQDGL